MDTNQTATLQGSIAIFCRTLKENDDPFSSDYYWQAYQDLMLALEKRGLSVYLTTDNNTYIDYGTFSVAYKIKGKTQLDNLIKVKNVKVDLVFDRGGFIGRGVPTINTPLMQKIGMNKIEMYKRFSKFQGFSAICINYGEVTKAFDDIEGERVVVKEPEGYGGHEVYIGYKNDVLSELPDRYPLLVQEFLDTSIGVPGYVTGVHDVRLSMCGGELIGCYIRQAKPGSLHSNVSQGGKMLFMNIDKTPPALIEAAKEVDKLFESSLRYYSIDFVNTTKGWKMLEINPYLALLPVTDGPEAIRTIEKLADYLATTIKTLPKHSD